MSINVTVVGSTNITAVIGNNDGVDVAIGGTLAYSPLTAIQVTAGANITVTTTSGVFTIIGRDVPVQSVNGQTGDVSITLANLTAAAASHTHVMSDISDLVFPVTTVNGQTGDVSLTVTDLTAALAVHTHSTTDVVGFTAAASAAAPVQSVAGRTGIVTLTAADVGGLAPVATSGSYTSLSDIPTSFTPASHTHQASEITNLTSVANVVSVNGITGTPVIVGGSGVTVNTAGSSITIEAAGVTDAGASLSDATPQPLGTAAAGVSGLASRADHVHDLPTISYTSLSNVPTAFAPDTSVANVVSVNGQTGVVSVQSGITALAVTSLQMTTDESSLSVSGGDIVRLTSSAEVTLGGLAGGEDGVLRLLYNVGTNAITLSSENANADATNRFSIVSGNVRLGEGDSASVWYDGTSRRWRSLEDQVPAAAGSASGGFAMSFLFG